MEFSGQLHAPATSPPPPHHHHHQASLDDWDILHSLFSLVVHSGMCFAGCYVPTLSLQADRVSKDTFQQLTEESMIQSDVASISKTQPY
jgi:hypothetical protein